MTYLAEHYSGNLPNIYIYSDIAEASLVGDVEASLRRIVQVGQQEHWTYECSTFNRLQFVPMAKNRFRNISVYLITDTGETIPFLPGKTAATLQIRKAESNYAS